MQGGTGDPAWRPSWWQWGLAVGGGITGMALLGYVVSGGKDAKTLRAERKRKEQQMKKRQQQMQQIMSVLSLQNDEGDEPPQSLEEAQQADELFGASVAHTGAGRAALPAQGGNNAQQLAGSAGSMSASKAAAALQMQQETQQLLRIVCLKAAELRSQGFNLQAADLYRRTIESLNPELEDFVEILLQLTGMAVSAYIEAGRAKEGLEWVLTFEKGIAKEPHKENVLLYKASVFRLYHKLRRPEAEDTLLQVLELTKHIHGKDSSKYAQQLFTYSVLLTHKDEFVKAEAVVREGIEILLAQHEGPTLTKELLGGYQQLEYTYLVQKRVDDAMQVYHELVKPKCDVKDVSFSWHRVYLAGNLCMFNYEVNAEELYRGVIDQWSDVAETTANQRIRSLVGNVMNELASLLLNSHREEEAKSMIQTVKDRRWGLLTMSKFFFSKTGTVVFEPHGQRFVGKLILVLQPRLTVKAGMHLVVHFDISEPPFDYVEEVTITEEHPITGIELESKGLTKFTVNVYELRCELYASPEKKELLYTHLQLIPSSIDTTNLTTWQDLQQAYANTQRG